MTDILHTALKDLKPGEEILCSNRSFRLLLERFFEFKQRNPSMKFVVHQESGIQRIKRMR